jgi:hypothetical protein
MICFVKLLGRVPSDMISRIVNILHTEEFLFTVADMCDFAGHLTFEYFKAKDVPIRLATILSSAIRAEVSTLKNENSESTKTLDRESVLQTVKEESARPAAAQTSGATNKSVSVRLMLSMWVWEGGCRLTVSG